MLDRRLLFHYYISKQMLAGFDFEDAALPFAAKNRFFLTLAIASLDHFW